MKPYAFNYMPINQKRMQNNDPQHSSNVVKNWFCGQAQSPDLNAIENLWHGCNQEKKL